MRYKEEAIECVKDSVLPIHEQIYRKCNGDFDRIFTEEYNTESYTGKVLESDLSKTPNIASVLARASCIFSRSWNLRASMMFRLLIQFSKAPNVALSESQKTNLLFRTFFTNQCSLSQIFGSLDNYAYLCKQVCENEQRLGN